MFPKPVSSVARNRGMNNWFEEESVIYVPEIWRD